MKWRFDTNKAEGETNLTVIFIGGKSAKIGKFDTYREAIEFVEIAIGRKLEKTDFKREFTVIK